MSNVYNLLSLINERSPFHFLIVRPIAANELCAWDTLMATHHYLGFRSLVGESIRYVAEIYSRLLALLGWCAAALKCRPRDTPIRPSVPKPFKLTMLEL